jgi:hypothetical protein
VHRVRHHRRGHILPPAVTQRGPLGAFLLQRMGNSGRCCRLVTMQVDQPIALSCQHCQEPIRIVRTAAVGLLHKRLVFECAQCGAIGILERTPQA